jgi:hypothetical protein
MLRPFLLIVMIGILAGCDLYLPSSHRRGLPPGHGGIPPGHGGIPPGQAKKMGPPPVVVVGLPRFNLVPDTNISVMIGVDADVFRVNGIYYYFHDNAWYKGRHYRGPWKAIAARNLPPGLRGKSPKKVKAKAKAKGKGKGWKKK